MYCIELDERCGQCSSFRSIKNLTFLIFGRSSPSGGADRWEATSACWKELACLTYRDLIFGLLEQGSQCNRYMRPIRRSWPLSLDKISPLRHVHSPKCCAFNKSRPRTMSKTPFKFIIAVSLRGLPRQGIT